MTRIHYLTIDLPNDPELFGMRLYFRGLYRSLRLKRETKKDGRTKTGGVRTDSDLYL